MKKTAFGGALALFGALAAALPAHAADSTRCSSSQILIDKTLNPGYQSCSLMPGIFDGSLAEVAELNSVYGPLTFYRLGLSTDQSSSFGPFASNPFGLSSGVLQLVDTRGDYFVLGLQALDPTSREEKILFYQFDYTGKGATRSIAFDTLGFDPRGASLQVASIYLPMLAVPEPATWSTALLGLGLLAAAKRRRGA